MEDLFNAIISFRTFEAKHLLLTNAEVISKLTSSIHVEFDDNEVNDYEILSTLAFMFREELIEYSIKHNRSMLHNAIKGGKNIKIIEAVINLDKDSINRICSVGMTPFLEAVFCNSDVSIIKLLLENNADVKICNWDGYYPLHYAENLEVVKLLIENGAQVNCVDSFGCTPLMAAIKYNRDKMIISELIKKGADVNQKNRDGKTCLHLALYFKYDEDIIEQICKKMLDYNGEDNEGLSPLCHAVTKCCEPLPKQVYQPDFIYKLINKGFIINSNVFLRSVKHWGHVELIAGLTKYVDIDCVDKDGNCALHHARDVRVVNMLVRRGASINHKNNKGNTPLVYAITMSRSIQIIESLLFWGWNGRNLDCLSEVENRLSVYGTNEVYNLCVLYGMSVSLKCESVKVYLSKCFSFLVKGWSTTWCYGLRHIFLSNENITVPDDLKVNNIITTYVSELKKMKGELLTDNLSYYNFCMKRYKSMRSPFLNRGLTEADYENIKLLFPTFYNEVIVKIKINIRIIRLKMLLRKLMNIILGKEQSEKENNSYENVGSSCEYVLLDCDSIYIVGSFMNERDIKCLLAAAIIDERTVKRHAKSF